MTQSWQPISTAPKNDERIIVAGGTWIRGNRQQIPQAFPCLVVWDETEWLICDNEGPRALIRGPKVWMAIPPLQMPDTEAGRHHVPLRKTVRPSSFRYRTTL
jgi:hypothetical protein